MTRFPGGARLGGALAALALLAACSDANRSATGILEPGAAPSFVSAGSQSSDWQQCANNGRNDAIPCEWINSVLNPGKATYREGELIPFRFAIHIVDMQGKKPVEPNPNTERRVTFTYGFNKATNGNYDFIGKFNQTEGVRANLCSADFSPVNGTYCNAPTGGALAGTLIGPTYGSDPSPLYANPDGTRHSVITIDSTKFLQNVPAALKPALSSALKTYLSKAGNKLEIDVFGGVGLSVDPVVYNVGGGDVTATITVRFRANQRNVLMAFGAHFARLQDWEKIGYNGGAGQSGSPFHIKVDSIDGTGAGALGNNVSGGVVVREANVTLAKTVSPSPGPITVGQPFSWSIVATNSGDGAAENLLIVDTLPTITGYTFSTASTGCAIANGILTCGPTSVAPASTFTALVTAQFTGSVTPATSCGSFPNVANIVGGGNAQVSITIQCPGLNVVKVADNLTVSAGSPIGFVVTLNSTGPGTALGATLSDALPTGTGVTWSIDAEHSDPGCSITNGTLSCTYGDLASGQSRSVHVTSPTTAASCKAYPNTASAQATNHAQIQASATTTVQCPNLHLTKVADQATVSAGTTIGYVLNVSNGGAGTAAGVTLTDVLPTNTGLSWAIDAANSSTGCSITSGTLTCDWGDLASGASKHVHITSPTAFATCGTVNNTGNVTTTNNGSDQASAPITVQCPALEITKNSDQSSVSAGMPIAFTVIVRNTGAGTAAGVTLSDALPGGTGVSWSINPAYAGPGTCQITGSAPSQTLSCSFGALASGASASVRVTSATTAASCKSYPNTASAQATNHAQVQAQATIDVQCPNLDLTKTADAATVSAGDPIGFTMTVTNSGAGSATGVTLTDALPANAGLLWSISPSNAACGIAGGTLTCNFGTLAPGGSASVHITSPTAFASCGTVNNTANVTTTNNGTDQASASVTVQCPALEVTKTADAATVSAGTAIGFTVTVRNTGTGIARSVTLSDALPGGTGILWAINPTAAGCSLTGSAPSQSLGCTFGDLAAGATRTVHVTSPTTSASCQLYANTASAQATNHAQVQAQANTTVQCPSISLTKVADQATVSAGTAIGFTMVVANAGPGTATGVTLTDVLPANAGLGWTISPATPGCSITGGTLTCNFGTLGVESRQVHVTSPTTFASCGTVNNTANVTTSNNGSDQASASVTVQCPNLSVSKTADAATVSAGTAIGFTIQVSNAGPGTAAAVTLSDALPGGTGVSWSINPAYAGPGTCQITGSAPSQTLSCSFGALASGASASVHVRSSTTPASCKTYANTASAQASNHAQVQAQASTDVLCPSLGITKTPATQTRSAGESFSWTVTLTNSGAGTAVGATINDPLPVVTGVGYTLGAGSDATCAITGSTLTCGPKDLATSATLVAVINATTTAGTSCANNGFTNTATGAATGVSNVQASATVTLNCPTLSITKTPDQAGDAGYSVLPNGTATFSITVANAGPGSAFNVTITDTLPAGLTWTDNKTDCAIGTIVVNSVNRQRLTCSGGELAELTATESFTVAVSATVPANFLQNADSPSGTALEIDGNLDDGAAAGADWGSLPSSVFSCTSNPKKGCDIDLPTGTTDNSFGQGTKEDTEVPSVVTGSIPNNKSDLLRFYVANERFVTTDFLYLAWERVQAPNGTTNMDFELNQSSTLSGNGLTPVRTAGDILVKYDLAQGGTNPTLGFHRWVTAASSGGASAGSACEASNSFPCWSKVISLVGNANVAAAINLTGVTDPISGQALDALTFGEARINLQGSGIFQPGACLSFGRAYLKSRSSDAFNSEIKDFIAPIPIAVSNCSPKPIDNKAWAAASGITAIFDDGHILVSQSAGGSASLFTVPTHGGVATLLAHGWPVMVATQDRLTIAVRALDRRSRRDAGREGDDRLAWTVATRRTDAG